jgi:hypothetical protein
VSEPANAAKVQIFGPGVEKGVKCNTPTHFNIDCRDAGQGILYYMCVCDCILLSLYYEAVVNVGITSACC